MKKLNLIIASLFAILLLLTPFPAMASWLTESSTVIGHGVTGNLTNGIALIGMLAPILLASCLIMGKYLRYKNSNIVKLKRA